MTEIPCRQKNNLKIVSNLVSISILLIFFQTASAQDVECDYSITTSNLADRTTLGFNLNAGVSLTQISGTITPVTSDVPQIALHFNGVENILPCASIPCNFGGINKTISFTQTVSAYSFEIVIVHAPIVGSEGESWELIIGNLTPDISRSVDLDITSSGGEVTLASCPAPQLTLINPPDESTPLDFGAVRKGDPAPSRSIEIRNDGNANLIFTANPNPPVFPFQYGGTPPSFSPPLHIPPGDTLAIPIAMSTLTQDSYNQTVSFAYTIDGTTTENLDIALEGDVTVSFIKVIDEAGDEIDALEFDTLVGVESIKTFTIENDETSGATADLNITSFEFAGISPEYYSASVTSTSIEVGTEAEVIITFSPNRDLSPGPLPANLRIQSDADNTLAPIDLNGVAKKVDIVLLLDISGSMSRLPNNNSTTDPALSRLGRLKDAANSLVDFIEITESDNPGISSISRLAVVVFSGTSTEARVHLIDSDGTGITAIRDAIDSLSAGGGTPMGDGIILAADEFGIGDSFRHLVLLFSDGDSNAGTPPQDQSIIGDCPPFPSTMPGVIQDKDITIFAFAYGENGAGQTNHTLLSELALCSGFHGDIFYDSGSGADLEAHFDKVYESMIDGVQTTTDPKKIISPGEIKHHIVPITGLDSNVIFFLRWDPAAKGEFALSLIAPDGTIINSPSPPDVKFYSGNTYKTIAVKLNDPAKIGEWTTVVNYTDPSGNPQETVEYIYSVLSTSKLAMDVEIDKDIPATGDLVMLKTKLNEKGLPLKNAQVRVKIQRAESGIGDWFKAENVTLGMLEQIPDSIDGDELSLTERIYQYLITRKGIAAPALVFDPQIELYDDGSHGDKEANDGIYTNSLEVNTPGVHSFLVSAKGITSSGNSFQRETLIQKVVKMIPDEDKTLKEGDIEKRNLDGSGLIRISVTPRDKAKNYFGPGLSDEEVKIECTASSACTPQTSVEDLLYGAYQRKFKLENIDEDPQIVITVKEVIVYDGSFAKLREPRYRWEVSGHIGYAIPHGSFANDFDGGISAMLDLGYRFTKSWSAELLLGYHNFESDGDDDDFYWFHTSLNGKYSYPIGIFRLFGNAGVGWYFPESGDSGLGFNLGGGLAYPFEERWGLELGYNYHKVTQTDEDEFSTINLGIRFSF